MNPKIHQHHLQSPAYIYLRQSTMGQVRLHQESTKRQYALKDKARLFGWEANNIKVLDADLGLSGTNTDDREDFKLLVADVSMNKVGAVFALEASRLSRSNADWYRLLELCSLTNTLLIDEDGCYDPADFNDQLLLGLKGTMSQAELHFIRARLQGGKLNKAKRGELRFPLPVGYVYDEQKHTVMDPDQEVQGAIRLLFDKFRESASAYAVVRYFAANKITFPKRAYGGVWAGKLIWGRLTHERVLSVLKNPSYTGAYVYGRYKYQKTLAEDGSIHQHMKEVPQDAWQVFIREHHEAYIPWEEHLNNQKILESNCTHGDQRATATAASKGSALLQGVLLCGDCGRKMTVRYTGSGGRYPIYQCSWKKREGIATCECFSMRADFIDRTVTERILALVQPEQINIALQALDELSKRGHRIERQREMRLEHAEYDAQLAQRRFTEVDPANRLVAATLEKQWNEALIHVEQVQREIQKQKNENSVEISPGNRALLLTLCNDLPSLWQAKSTQYKDKKRIIRLLLKDVTLNKQENELFIHIRWQGGVNETITTNVPKKSYEKWRHPVEVVEKIRELSLQFDDKYIAEYFNQQGIKTNKGNQFTVDSIKWVRYKYKIPAPDFRKPGELTVNEVMKKFGVSRHVVYYWINTKTINAQKLKAGAPFYISLNEAKENELREWVENSSRI
jgi:DNA invertase Pin-like site-specific DNA recombinase